MILQRERESTTMKQSGSWATIWRAFVGYHGRKCVDMDDERKEIIGMRLSNETSRDKDDHDSEEHQFNLRKFKVHRHLKSICEKKSKIERERDREQ